MSEIEPAVVANDVVVSFNYTLSVDGEQLESSMESGPLDYLHGHNNLISGLENQMVGMAAGDFREILVAARDGYGEVDPSAFIELDRSQFPPDFPIEVGRPLRVRGHNGQATPARIAKIYDSKVQLDMNHPLAGKDLQFTARIVALRQATEEELQNGRLGGCSSCSSDCGSGSCSC